MDWSTGNNKSIVAGSRVFLLRQAVDRGIIAAGYTASGVFEDSHWSGSGANAKYAQVEFEVVLSVQDVLSIEKLEEARLGISWNHVQASGIQVPAQAVRRLEELWDSHLSEHRRIPTLLLGETGSPGTFVEGAVRRVFVNAYERNPAARQACIDHYGTTCVVCGFNFGSFYGSMGEGFIHVHHLRSLSTVGVEYEVDPIADLRPVCPNCHAMLHTSASDMMSIEELKHLVDARRSQGR